MIPDVVWKTGRRAAADRILSAGLSVLARARYSQPSRRFRTSGRVWAYRGDVLGPGGLEIPPLRFLKNLRECGTMISRYQDTWRMMAQARGDVKMRSMTIRLSEEQYEQLQLAAVIERRTMASIVREGLDERLEDRSHTLDRVKQAIAEARSRAPASEEAALKIAALAAQVDDSEGLGEVRVVRSRAKESGRQPRKTTGKAGGS